LVLHGGGNTSLKSSAKNTLGEERGVIFVKASGQDMASIEPESHTALDLDYLRRLRALRDLSETDMVNELRTHLLDYRARTPSIEAFMHAFIPAKYVDHVHPDAVLALTNQPDPERQVRSALGADVAVVPYVRAGFGLALAAAEALEAHPRCRALVLLQHGLVTWGETARESYDLTIELVTWAEQYLSERVRRSAMVPDSGAIELAWSRYARTAPILRGLLAQPVDDSDHPYARMILLPLISAEVLGLIGSERGRELTVSSTLTPDHLIRTKALPLWVDQPDYDNLGRLRAQLQEAVSGYAREYGEYLGRHRLPPGLSAFDPLPRVVLMPGLGAVCAGEDVHAAAIVRDITEQTLAVKASLASLDVQYVGLDEDHLFAMEYFPLQHAKLAKGPPRPLARHVSLVTGAAGAIGMGICEGLLQQGSHVAVTDLAGENLDAVVKSLQETYGRRVAGVPLDVTDVESVQHGFEQVIRTWGGVDLVVANAGIAMVASLSEMSPESFRRVERVNIEGTLLVLAETARHFKLQGTGGDVVLVSTKNVFAPGAKFGAYSATKAAAHQLARIASLELADLGVRVNMVAPDAVFSHGGRRSGLWAEVGPDRMKARGLDEKGLEEYYRTRNLLKARVTAEHVARAVLFFATRQTPTTGATIPVDGGLPDSTPR
jgi:rhamnose utilization protein RhaD (predicted bifunctional aldolase and dehydrogenase)/NAD(P)-dependent dehydrogenase (short-subunit alcohol dehydrogenase family)